MEGGEPGVGELCVHDGRLPAGRVAFCGQAAVVLSVALAERLGARGDRPGHPAGDFPVATRAGEDSAAPDTLTRVPTRTRPASGAELHATLTALSRPMISTRRCPCTGRSPATTT